MRALSIAATGMQAQQTNTDVTANNIANMNTTGFKRDRAEFSDLLYQHERRVGSVTSGQDTRAPTGIQIGAGVKVAGVYKVSEQGSLVQTENNYDLAIDGGGYFRIELPSGEEAYTRAGSFQRSADGELVTSEGFRVLPGITIPQNVVDVSISPSGQVEVRTAGDPQPQQVGQIELATFQNDAGLEKVGDNLMIETAASGPPITAAPGEPGFGLVRQGFLEASNVNPVSEITALIKAQRAYEMNSRVIKAADEMLAATSQGR